jgi:hypothetical protein
LNTSAIGDRLFDLQRMASAQKAALEDLTPHIDDDLARRNPEQWNRKFADAPG